MQGNLKNIAQIALKPSACYRVDKFSLEVSLIMLSTPWEEQTVNNSRENLHSTIAKYDLILAANYGT